MEKDNSAPRFLLLYTHTYREIFLKSEVITNYKADHVCTFQLLLGYSLLLMEKPKKLLSTNTGDEHISIFSKPKDRKHFECLNKKMEDIKVDISVLPLNYNSER